jgi:hypothetical protein
MAGGAARVGEVAAEVVRDGERRSDQAERGAVVAWKRCTGVAAAHTPTTTKAHFICRTCNPFFLPPHTHVHTHAHLLTPRPVTPFLNQGAVLRVGGSHLLEHQLVIVLF